MTEQAKRKRGRPPGAKNVAPIVRTVSDVEPGFLPDMQEMIARQLRIIGAAQAVLEDKINSGDMSAKAISDLSGALARAVTGVSHAAKAQEDFLSRLSRQQAVETALRTLEAQEDGVINYALRRLRKQKDDGSALATASDAIGSL